jgi:uncharacterized membrane protein YbhN (UPF0104 family)
MRKPARRALRLALKIALAGVGIVLVARAFAGTDWHATFRVLSAAGPFAIVAFVPFGVALVLDSTGVMLVARARDVSLRAASALRIRVVCEAFHYGAPGGVVASEAAAVAMFVRACAVTPREAGALAAGRKELVMRAHALYLVLGALVGASAFTTLARAFHTHVSLAWLACASASVPLAMSIALGHATRRVLGPDRRAHSRALGTLVFLAAWLVEAAETAVIARLAGIPLSMSAVLAIECALSLARSAVAFVPGGLGVQDATYATLLGALGAPHESAAAFVLLKRAKEVAWIAIGFAVSSVRRRRNDDRVDRRDVSTGGVRV